MSEEKVTPPPTIEIEANPAIKEAISQISAVILEKNKFGGFVNQNGFTEFLRQQLEKYFPNSTLTENVLYSMSWGDNNSLCIMNYCDFAKPERNDEEESFYFKDWDAARFEEALLQFIHR